MSKMDHIEGHAYSKAAKRRAHAARRAQLQAVSRQAQSFAIASVPRRPKQGKARMAEIKVERDPQIDMLKARCRRWGRPSSEWREMRDQWWGCEAGATIARQIPDHRTRQAFWEAIQHVRAAYVAFDRAIGAPNRHAQCLRLLLPLEELHADSTTPPIDERSDEQKQDQAVEALQRVQERLARSGPGPCAEALRVILEDDACRSPSALIAALEHVVDMRAGR